MEFCHKKHTMRYLHPLVKDMTIAEQDSQDNPPSLHLFYHSNNPSIPSSKIVRTTHKWGMINRKTQMVLQPFHPGVYIPQVNRAIICKKCQVYMNSQCQVLNTCQYQCNCCATVQDYDQTLAQPLLANAVYDLTSQSLSQSTHTNTNIKKVLFAVELNEYSYNYKIHEVLESILQASLNQPVEYGFLLFTQSYIYLLSIEENRLYKLLLTHNQTLQLPIPHSMLFKPAIHHNINEILSIIKDLLYQSCYSKKSAVHGVCEFLRNNLHPFNGISCKFIINSLDSSQAEMNKENGITSPFEDCSFDFFVINQSVSYKRAISSFIGKQVCRIYNAKKFNASELYYDIFHNIQMESYNSVKLTIRSTQFVSMAKKEMYFKRLTSQMPIVVEFSINESYLQGKSRKQSIQLELEYSFGRKRIINYIIPQILAVKSPSFKQEVSLINDEIYLYTMIRRILTKIPPKKIVAEIIAQLKAIRTVFCDSTNLDNVAIPKHLIKLFLYVYLAISQDYFCIHSQFSSYAQHQFLNMNIETFIKSLYLPTYQIEPQLRNIKSMASEFQSNKIFLVENGKVIFLVIGEEYPIAQLKQLFGEWDIHLIKRQTHIPILNTNINKQVRTAVDLIQSRNQLFYMPLKILTLESSEFDQQIGRYLYVSDDHRRFLSKIWK